MGKNQVNKARQLWKTTVVSILVLILSFFTLWLGSNQYESLLKAKHRTQMEDSVSRYGNALNLSLNKRLDLLQGVDAFVRVHPSEEELDNLFESYAAGLYAASTGIRAIQAFPREAVVHLYPLHGNEAVIARTLEDLLNDQRPGVSEDVMRSIESRRIGLSEPYELLQGGLGLVARKAIFQGDSLWGLVVIVLDVHPLLKESGIEPQPVDLKLAIRSKASGRLFLGDDALFAADPVLFSIPLPEGEWVLAAVPAIGWDRLIAQELRLFQGMGFAIIGLIVFLGHTIISRQSFLRKAIKERTAELEESQARYKQLFDGNYDALFLLDESGNIQDANQVVSKRYGFERDELLKMHACDLAPPEFKSQVSTRITNGLEKAASFSWRHRRKDQSEFPVEISAQPVILNGRRHILASVRDVTEKVKAEEDRDRLMSAIEQAAEVIVITDVHGSVRYVNPVFEKTTGYPRREVLGQNLRMLKSGEHDAAFYKKMWSVLTSGESWKGTLVNRKKNGIIYSEEATISPVRDSSGNIISYVAVKRDITREVELEDQLRQAQKMEAVGRLAGGVAHDFNNMLSIINGYAEMIMEKLDPSDSLHDDVNEIRKAGERSATLTRQLLAFAREQTVSPLVLDLNFQIQHSKKMLERLIGEDIALEMIPSPDLWMVKMDPSQVDQVLANLAVNSRDAIDGVGCITIETSNAEIDEVFCRNHPGCVPGQFVLVTFGDTGSGMSEEIQDKIFEPFFTTQELGKGTGLGLSTVYGIIKQNKGFIYVSSEPGKGTIFELYFPRVEGEPVSEASSDPVSTVRGRETILVVEDEKQIMDLCRRVLEVNGYKIIASSDPGEAIQLCEETYGKIPLMITDVVMPTMNGRELFARIKTIRPDIKVLFMSGYTADIIANRGILAEEVHFIQKPFSPGDLVQRVRAMLDQ